MYIWGFAAGNFFSLLLLQEEQRVVASAGEQSKARSDKQKFGKDPLSKQEKREVGRKEEETCWVFLVFGGSICLFVFILHFSCKGSPCIY